MEGNRLLGEHLRAGKEEQRRHVHKAAAGEAAEALRDHDGVMRRQS